MQVAALWPASFFLWMSPVHWSLLISREKDRIHFLTRFHVDIEKMNYPILWLNLGCHNCHLNCGDDEIWGFYFFLFGEVEAQDIESGNQRYRTPYNTALRSMDKWFYFVVQKYLQCTWNNNILANRLTVLNILCKNWINNIIGKVTGLWKQWLYDLKQRSVPFIMEQMGCHSWRVKWYNLKVPVSHFTGYNGICQWEWTCQTLLSCSWIARNGCFSWFRTTFRGRVMSV